MKRAFYPKKQNVIKWISELETAKSIYEKMNKDFSAGEKQLAEYKELLAEYESNGIDF